MNRDDIIRMAKEAWGDEKYSQWKQFEDMFERFAELVAAAEREACAKVCEDGVNAERYPTMTEIAAAIRARGEP